MSLDSPGDPLGSARRAESLREYAAALAAREELLELTHDGIIVRDMVGEIVFWNHGAEELYGWSRAEVRGKTTDQVLRTEFPEPLEQIIAHTKQKGRWDGELIHTRKDGARLIISSRWSLQYDANGAPLGIVEMNDDITERRRIDQQLRSNQAQLAGIINSAIDAIISTDEDQNIIIFNAAAEKMFGWTAHEILGKPLSTLIPDKFRQAHQFQVLEFGRTGLARRLKEQLEDLRGLRRDGSEFPMEASISQVQMEGAKIYSVILRDITQRQRAEAAEYAQRIFAQALADTAAALNSTLDFETVLDKILENANKVVPHDAGCIMLVEEDFARVVRSRGYEPGQEAKIISLRLALAETPNLQEMANTGQPKRIPDVKNYPGWRETAVFTEQRASLGVPIRNRGKTTGFITLDSFTLNTFTQTDAEHLLAFADQASIAMENARLLDEAKERAEEFSELYGMAQNFMQQNDLNALLQTVVTQAALLLSVSSGALWLYDAQENDLEAAVVFNVPGLAGARVKVGNGATGRVAATREPLIVNDYNASPFHGTVPAVPDFNSLIVVPLLSGGELMGVLVVGEPVSATREFTQADVQLLSLLAGPAAGAIYNARLLEKTQQQLERLSALRTIDLAISGSLDLRIALNVVLEQTLSQLHVDAAALLLLNPYTTMLEYAGSRGFRTREIANTQVRLGEGFAGRAALERQLVHVQNLTNATPGLRRAALVALENFVTYYAVPLVVKGQVKGVLEIYHRAPLTPDDSWLAFLESLGGQAALAIDNAELYSKLEHTNLELVSAYDTTLGGWAHALDLRDNESEGHAERVSELTVRLARALDVADSEIVHIRRGALLHDIGNMRIPESILVKPARLNEKEWEIVRKHPVYAYEILSGIPYLRPALSIPYAHHEKWDGTGYPRGLKGAEIPLAARIFAVVDVYDALCSNRPYRQAWDKERAREYIQSNAGIHFDPAPVQAFLALDL